MGKNHSSTPTHSIILSKAKQAFKKRWFRWLLYCFATFLVLLLIIALALISPQTLIAVLLVVFSTALDKIADIVIDNRRKKPKE